MSTHSRVLTWFVVSFIIFFALYRLPDAAQVGAAAWVAFVVAFWPLAALIVSMLALERFIQAGQWWGVAIGTAVIVMAGHVLSGRMSSWLIGLGVPPVVAFILGWVVVLPYFSPLVLADAAPSQDDGQDVVNR